MKSDMDIIKMESRKEIRDVCRALAEWQKQNEWNESVEAMIKILDYMDMVW